LHIFSDDRTFVYVRDFQPRADSSGQQAERLLMLMNNADQPRTVEVPISDTVLAHARKLTRVWADQDATLTSGSKILVELPARSLSIYAVEDSHIKTSDKEEQRKQRN
jgi:hypothetical protein